MQPLRNGCFIQHSNDQHVVAIEFVAGESSDRWFDLHEAIAADNFEGVCLSL